MLRLLRRERELRRSGIGTNGEGERALRTIATAIKRGARAALDAVHRHLLAWTRPATGPFVGSMAGDLTRTKAAVVAENALLRHQLVVLGRQVKRPVLTPADRLRLILLARLARGWRAALLIVQPEILLRWHRHGFRLVRRARSRGTSQRPQVSAETVAAIRRLAAENRLWGAERIRGALRKLGIRVGKRTVQRHMRAARPPRRRGDGQTWASFLRNHAPETWACDFLPVVDRGFRSLCAFVVVALGSRRVVHVGVTRHPADACVAQQLREATPFAQRPRYLIRDNDGKYGAAFARVAAGSRITVLRTPIRAPRANAPASASSGACAASASITSSSWVRRTCGGYCGSTRRTATPRGPTKASGRQSLAPSSQRRVSIRRHLSSPSPCWAGCTTTTTGGLSALCRDSMLGRRREPVQLLTIDTNVKVIVPST